MTVSVADFQAQFAEFSRTSPRKIEIFLADAVLFVSPQQWCAKTDAGVAYLAAHNLASDPAGLSPSLIQKPDPQYGPYGTTRYGVRFAQMRDEVMGGYVGVIA